MVPSSRIRNVLSGGSDGWEVFHKARALNAAGREVIELTIGEHDIRTAAPILQEMHRAALAGHTGYAAVPGTDSLRDTIAARAEARTGVPTRRANVLVTPGGQAALFAAFMAVCDPGDAALFIDPYYTTYPGTLRAAGARPVAVPALAEAGFLPRGTDLAQAAKGAKALLINTPNNPTGVIYGRETLEEIAQVCRDHDLWLISDEVYDTQVWDDTHLSPRALPGMAERTLVVGSMSKSHAMTGSRCGWLIGPAEIIGHMADLATHTNYGVPGFIQDASEYALAQGAGFEAEISAPFARRRAIAQGILGAQQTLGLVPSQGAMYLMLDIRATGMTATAFAEGLLEAEGIAVMPGDSFGAAAAGHIRVAMTVDDRLFEEALTRLCHFASEQAARAA